VRQQPPSDLFLICFGEVRYLLNCLFECSHHEEYCSTSSLFSTARRRWKCNNGISAFYLHGPHQLLTPVRRVAAGPTVPNRCQHNGSEAAVTF
jgi:hypothetical protein